MPTSPRRRWAEAASPSDRARSSLVAPAASAVREGEVADRRGTCARRRRRPRGDDAHDRRRQPMCEVGHLERGGAGVVGERGDELPVHQRPVGEDERRAGRGHLGAEQHERVHAGRAERDRAARGAGWRPARGSTAGYAERTKTKRTAARSSIAVARCAVTDSPELPVSTVHLPSHAWKPARTSAAIDTTTTERVARWYRHALEDEPEHQEADDARPTSDGSTRSTPRCRPAAG